MNRLQSVIFGLVLYYLCSILPAYAEISNHQIFYRQDKRAPLTRIDIIFLGAGSNQESPSQNGLAEIASKLIWKDIEKRGYIDQLAVLGTELYVFANTTSLTVSISTLSENCAESIEIVRDSIHNFEFSESDLEDVKKREVTNYGCRLGFTFSLPHLCSAGIGIVFEFVPLLVQVVAFCVLKAMRLIGLPKACPSL